MMDFIYDILHILPLNIVISFSIFSYLRIDGNSITGCIINLIVTIVVIAVIHIGARERLLVCGSITVILAGLFFLIGKEKRDSLLMSYSYVFWLFCITLLLILAVRLFREHLWWKIAVTAMLISNAVYFLIGRYSISSVAIFASIVVIMLYILEIIQVHWEKSGYTDLKSHIVNISPILVLLVLVLCFLPVPKEPFDWKFAKDIWKITVQECKRISSAFSHQEDEYKYTGFSNDSSFASTLDKNEKEVMIVSTGGKGADNIYLEGIVFDTFKSNEWENNTDLEENNSQLDYLETRAAISKGLVESETGFIKDELLSVENRQSKTKHLFLPNKVNICGKNTVIPAYEQKGDGLLVNDLLRYGDGYKMAYSRLNYDNPELIELINNASPIEEDEWQKTVNISLATNEEQFSFEAYKKYQKKIYEKYAVKDGMSDEVKELVDSVTAGVEGDYEKLMAVASYLQSFEYNSRPGKLPNSIADSRDYLDYFILNSRSGYCNHFATAFVLLARELGYPARYVQGYYVKKAENISEVHVSEASAHSYAEVYFDNFGWVIFEATPGYAVQKGWRYNTGQNAAKAVKYSGTEQEIGQDTKEEVDITKKEKTFYAKYILVPILGALIFGLIFLLCDKLFNYIRYQNMSDEQRARYLIRRNLMILKKMGYQLHDNETIEEYRKRLTMENACDTCGLVFLTIYEKLLYSKYEMDLRSVDIILEENSNLREILRKNRRFMARNLFL